MIEELQQGEHLDLYTLPDKSILAVKKQFSQTGQGDYMLVRRIPYGTDFTDIIIEDNFFTIEPVKERAITHFNILKEELK